MSIDAIALDFLSQALRAYQQSQDPPAELLNLALFSDAASAVERRIRLQEWLTEQTTTQLERLRRLEGMAFAPTPDQSREMLVAALAADFRRSNVDLEAWSAVYHRYLAPLLLSVNDLTTTAGVAERQFRRRVDEGVNRLTELLRRAELEARTQPLGRELNLPSPDYVKLFGVEDFITRLVAQIISTTGAPLISIEGLGGIGKTALAQAVARHLSGHSHFAGLIWLSARHEWVTERGEIHTIENPARTRDDLVTRLAQQLGLDQLIGLSVTDKIAGLHAVLSRRPHLIIVDNLETLADGELLVPDLQRLAGLTRFVITSRHTLRHFPYVQINTVPELDLTTSHTFINHELTRRGRADRLALSDMPPLYAVTGGLPLALKLTAAQLSHLPLAEVLAGLRHVQHRTPDALYTYIYRRAWSLLDERARQLLVSLLLISPDGDSLDWVRAMSALDPADFEPALTQLLDASLIEVGGTLAAPRYYLHRLTTTFLQANFAQRWTA